MVSRSGGRSVTIFRPKRSMPSMRKGIRERPSRWHDYGPAIRSWGAIPALLRFGSRFPRGAGLFGVIAPASVKRLEGVVSLTPADPLYYTDLPMEASSFRYGSFEFV